MVLDGLGISLPWLWGNGQSSKETSGSRSKRHRRKSSSAASKPKGTGVVRTRAEQIAQQKANREHNANTEDSEYDEAQYYPGLVNISGTYCFMNSTLQALASLTYLQPHIDTIHSRAEALDVPTPVIDALQDLFKNLNTPKSSYHALRPHSIIQALSSPQPQPADLSGSFRSTTSSSLFNSREHQDAQELFQLVSECIKNEMIIVDKEGLRDRGIAGVLDIKPSNTSQQGQDESMEAFKNNNKSVFDGLTANRRSCVMCGYTEAVMHFGFDNWQLAVPRLAQSCRLEDCIEDYTRLEILKDCVCRKCSVLATHKRLLTELKTLEEALIIPPTSPTSTPSKLSSNVTPFTASSPVASSSSMPQTSPQKSKPSQSKKKRYKEVKKMEQRVRAALEEGRIEDETLFEGVRLEKVVSPASTKQAMIARPPPVLALHLNRSMHYGSYAAKNSIRVHFPEILDLTPFTTSGSLSTIPTANISTPAPAPATNISFTAPNPPQSDKSNHQGQGQQQQPKRPTTPTQEMYSSASQRTIYRLAAVVCHFGQHSFGHYICYRRKPHPGLSKGVGGKQEWIPPTLVNPQQDFDVDMEGEEIDEGVDGDIETEVEGDGTLRMRKTGNGSAKLRRPSISALFNSRGATSHSSSSSSLSSSSTSSRSSYHFADHSELQAGSGRGWLRISDDSVQEVGIESVLNETGGVFMLYYERVLQPVSSRVYAAKPNGRGTQTPLGRERHLNGGALWNGNGSYTHRPDGALLVNGDTTESEDDTGTETDADGFSIGSEETLKPQTKVVDLNGSVGSLVSEVGVGVMKTSGKGKEKDKSGKNGKEKDKNSERMSMSMYSTGSSGSSSYSGYSSSSRGTGVGARIIRNVSAGRRLLPSSSSLSSSPSSKHQANGHGHSLLFLSPPSPSPSLADIESIGPKPQLSTTLFNGNNLDGSDERVPHEMIASAPSILNAVQIPSSSSSSAAVSASSSKIGSNSTKILHRQPIGPSTAKVLGGGVKVKAR
ncbi:hypothetical protein CPB83DRAFT_855133 [Crepidotus variabilis]|uniref:ubiquitinyl hydrolase 1 n=1 Tax=Crepidotus variabilis TaxID=179855 RepID=A0A9P6JPN3_9AGAR|nr:hypothetical protein CPB83DRAFT_855133 [Crepidotus variabilis]